MDGAFFDPRSIFDPVIRGQRSNFRDIGNFSILHYRISKIINRIGIKLSLASSLFTFERKKVSLPFIDRMFVTHSVSKGNSVDLIGKIA